MGRRYRKKHSTWSWYLCRDLRSRAVLGTKGESSVQVCYLCCEFDAMRSESHLQGAKYFGLVCANSHAANQGLGHYYWILLFEVKVLLKRTNISLPISIAVAKISHHFHVSCIGVIHTQTQVRKVQCTQSGLLLRCVPLPAQHFQDTGQCGDCSEHREDKQLQWQSRII